jgi:regulator of RNase E activity RraB
MSEDELLKRIAAHDARNKALLVTLSEHKVALDQPRGVEHHFYARGHRAAVMLAKTLYDQGFLVLVLNRAASGKHWEGDVWNVEAEMTSSPEVAASHETAERLSRLADAHSGEYDGWGTSV